MIIKSAEYKVSCVKEEACPKENFPEFAFIGRSNVGKSSLINMLTDKKDLVKISNSPGKTRTINFFLINNQFHFVDLPGYGYAKVSHDQRKQFEQMIFDYLGKRMQLQVVFVLIDSRHQPQQLDLDFINDLGKRQIPFVLVFTKADKHGIETTNKNIVLLHDKMMVTWEMIPQTFITSAIDRTGREEILDFIEEIISAYKK
ncbi:MAG TPA: ribosome biogenesis GTP-binding protein YihA/YsxC [Chitinophagales bacterium]|nr:ribosome biogenesis GTP-binding protein YihA/YsxC [Chitinophagales bacterium]